MTIASTLSRWEYDGDGSTVTFPYTNKIFVDADLNVYVDAVLQTLSTDYTVTGAGDDNGNVVFVTPPADGTDIIIVRSLTDDQQTDLPVGGAFPAESVEDMSDRRTIISQQQQEEIDRCLKIPVSDTSSASAYDAGNLEIENVAQGNADTSGVNRGQVNTLIAAAQLGTTSEAAIFEVASLTELQGVATSGFSGGELRYMTGRSSISDGGEGLFTWRTGDQSANITADEVTGSGGDGGVWIAPTSDLTGASGAWERIGYEYTSLGMYGATGDGVTDDTTAIQTAIDYAKTSGRRLAVEPGTYLISSTLDLNDGFNNSVSMFGLGGYSNEPTLKFADGVTIGLQCVNGKNTLIQDLIVDMSLVTNDCIGVLWYGIWESKISNVPIVGPGATDPSSGQASYGFVMRPTYNGAVTSKAAAVDVETIIGANTGTNQGVYWNLIEDLSVNLFGYGVVMFGGEGGTNPRTNQNQFNSCKINGNYYNINMDGIGGGNVFNATTAEGSTGESVHVVSVSGGTGPVWIGGELNGSGDLWKGPGLLLNAPAGISFPTANASGERGTHLRFTDMGPELFGDALPGANFISTWDTKQDAPVSGSGTTSSKTLDIATIAPDGAGSDTAAYEVSVAMTDGGSPQGTSIMVYHILLNRANGQALTAAASLISDRTVFHNLGGGTVAPDITVSVLGSVATIATNINWDTVGNDPGESDVQYYIRDIASATVDGWTVTAL